MNSAADHLNTLGTGGILFVRNGTYTFSSASFQIVGMYPHQTWIGENKNKVIIKNQSPTHPAFATYANYPPTGQLDSFQMHNMTLQADNPTHATVMFAPGTKNCVFKDNIFRAPKYPSDSSFIVYWNVTYGGNDRMTFRDNLIEGSTNGQDMFGSGVLNDCDISNNWFVGINDGQGIGVTAQEIQSSTSTISSKRVILSVWRTIAKEIGIAATSWKTVLVGSNSHILVEATLIRVLVIYVPIIFSDMGPQE